MVAYKIIIDCSRLLIITSGTIKTVLENDGEICNYEQHLCIQTSGTNQNPNMVITALVNN